MDIIDWYWHRKMGRYDTRRLALENRMKNLIRRWSREVDRSRGGVGRMAFLSDTFWSSGFYGFSLGALALLRFGTVFNFF